MLGLTTAKSISATARASVRCPIGSVFDFVGDNFFQNYTRWCPQVIELEPLSDGPVRAGVTARQITLDRGIRSESTFEITTFCPPKLLGLKGLSETFKSSYEFEEQGFDRPLRSLLQRGANEILERAHEQLPFLQFEAEDHLAREPARKRL